MAVSSTLTQALVCVFVFVSMGQLGTITALRCFNCAYMTSMEGEQIYIRRVTESYINEFYYEDHTCIGNNPDPSLSVDCSVPRKLSRSESSEDGDEIQGKKKIKYSRIDKNATYVCMHKIYKEQLPTGIQISTFRSCIPSNWDINKAMDKYNKEMNTTSVGYTCDTDNCNNRIESDDENKSSSKSGPKTTTAKSMSYIFIFVLVKFL